MNVAQLSSATGLTAAVAVGLLAALNVALWTLRVALAARDRRTLAALVAGVEPGPLGELGWRGSAVGQCSVEPGLEADVDGQYLRAGE